MVVRPVCAYMCMFLYVRLYSCHNIFQCVPDLAVKIDGDPHLFIALGDVIYIVVK